MNVSQMLNAAAMHMERKGWWGASNPSHAGCKDPACASNAIWRLNGHTPHAAHEALWEYLGGRSAYDIFKWNDAPGQTRENVCATMRACAALWKMKHQESLACQNLTSEKLCEELHAS